MPTQRQPYADLYSLFVLKLESLYDIERFQLKFLLRMARTASDAGLRTALERHVDETKLQSERLHEALDLLGEKLSPSSVAAIRGLGKDAEWLMKRIDQRALDASLIAAAQYVDHYEIAGYGTAHEWAKALGYAPVAELLHRSLDEEKASNARLNALAISQINTRTQHALSAS